MKLIISLLLALSLAGCASSQYGINDAYVDVAAVATAIGNAAAEGRISQEQKSDYLDAVEEVKRSLDVAALIADAETRQEAVRRAISIGRPELIKILAELEEKANEPE